MREARIFAQSLLLPQNCPVRAQLDWDHPNDRIFLCLTHAHCAFDFYYNRVINLISLINTQFLNHCFGSVKSFGYLKFLGGPS